MSQATRIVVRSVSILTKEATRIAVRKQKRANCAVYGFGLSASGALSIPALVVQNNKVTSRETHKPLRISYCNLREIKKVSSGFGFSLFASGKRVYGSGLNNRLQIAGRTIDDSGKEEYYISGRRIGGLPEGKIVDIASGRAHSLVIVDDKVYAFGCNVHGQCGQNPETAQTVVASGDSEFLLPVDLPSSSPPVKVHASLDTSYVITKDGMIFAFGLNEDGQCANGEQGIQPHPREVMGDTQGERIVSIQGSTDTLMAISEGGKLFVWGQNEYGQAGEEHGEEIQLTASRAFSCPSLSNSRVISAAATATTCAAVTEDGAVLTWGVGVVGHGPDVMRLKRPTRLPEKLFDGVKVRSVHGGNVAMAAINEEGNMHVWGQNRYGLLGLGHDKDQLFPFPLFFQEDVKQISIGPDHTLVLVK